MVPQRIFVMGGSGFIGSAICRAAVQHGVKVTSLSRSGRPIGQGAPWMDRVDWIVGDALQPETYEAQAREATTLVHAVGSLTADGGYKSILGKSSSQTSSGARVSLDQINRDTALALAEACDDGTERGFLFLSAAVQPPLADPCYLSSKRQVEAALIAQQNLRPIIFRPGLVYGEAEPVSMTLAVGLTMADKLFNKLKPLAPPDVQAMASSYKGDMYAKPISVLTLAQAAINAVIHGKDGTFGPDEISALAQHA